MQEMESDGIMRRCIFLSFTVSVCFTFYVIVFSYPAVSVPSFMSALISSLWMSFTLCAVCCAQFAVRRAARRFLLHFVTLCE